MLTFLSMAVMTSSRNKLKSSLKNRPWTIITICLLTACLFRYHPIIVVVFQTAVPNLTTTKNSKTLLNCTERTFLTLKVWLFWRKNPLWKKIMCTQLHYSLSHYSWHQYSVTVCHRHWTLHSWSFVSINNHWILKYQSRCH